MLTGTAAHASFNRLKKELERHDVKSSYSGGNIRFTHNDNCLTLHLNGGEFSVTAEQPDVLPLDYLVREPQKIAALVLSRMSLNRRVFARQCELRTVDKQNAAVFLDTYHVMNSTQSAYNLGLFYKTELIGLASFSKGRKMDRLPAEQRSFELIRFCCKSGITITGGLTKLVRNFALEKKAGDIMTYVDKQLSDGTSFIRAGFKKTEESEPVQFLVNKTTFERALYKGEDVDHTQFYLAKNFGNLKLIYTPGD